MAITSVPQHRVIIVGAGASFPYSLPLASTLLYDAIDRISSVTKKYKEITTGRRLYSPVNAKISISNADPVGGAVLNAISDPLTPLDVCETFHEHLVHQNLDDFVRDHPSLTGVVAALISASLFAAMYKRKEFYWELRDDLKLAGTSIRNDWMRQFVGVARPLASKDNKLTIISFNYDYLLERSMRKYWHGAETEYPQLDDSVCFIYPHGRFSQLPERVNDPMLFIDEQAKNLRVGASRDEVARANAKEAVKQATGIYAVGFSFSDNNVELLGFDKLRSSVAYIQNFENRDIRLRRKLHEWGHSNMRQDTGDMNTLVTNGFFEQ